MKKAAYQLVAAVALVLTPMLAVPAQAEEKRQTFSYEEFRAASSGLSTKYLNDRVDYVAYARELEALGAKNIRISNQVAGIINSTPEEAQFAYQLYARKAAAAASPDYGVMDVPINAFTASTIAYNFPYSNSTGSGWLDNTELHWNFRDNFVNGSAPDDAIGIALDAYDFNCYSAVRTWKESYTWDGSRQTSQDYIYQENLTTSNAVWRVRDRVSGFQLLVDHGFVALVLDHPNGRSCANPNQRIVGSGWYEHNQDGGGTWTAGISFFGMSLEYSSEADKLQKAGGVATIR
ncbi:hypothetical protein AB0A95_31250 [Micromonospora sp. NPDC049230]|uniref:hypothetical protein n=1 Tax=Micromonospora sp. NPDC049230 TaxID=3155502 RepID=UPI0033C2D4A4